MMKSFPSTLVFLRRERSLSQRALAEKAGVSRSEIAALEGAAWSPSLATMQKLADALEIPVSGLLQDDQETTSSADSGTEEDPA